MKIKEGFVLRTVAGQNVVIAIGDATQILNGMMKLNDSAVFLWKLLEKGTEREEMCLELQKKYQVSEQQAETGLEQFLQALTNVGCLEN